MVRKTSRKKGDPALPGAGRKVGSLNKRTIMMNALGEEGGQRILNKLFDIAVNGDPEKPTTLQALLFFGERITPKGAPLSCSLPEINRLEDVYKSGVSVLNKVLTQEINPIEGAQMIDTLEKIKIFLKESELLERLTIVEEHYNL